tara:strand:+ start:199 stop:546 length:348 start_codon:yes stop_codon:yes gene_type:complete
MKGIFKIEEHLPDTKQIVVKFCRANSHKSIDEYAGKAVGYEDLDLTESELFIDGLMKKTGLRKIDNQELAEPILDVNKSESISGLVNLDDLVGKVIDGTVVERNMAPLKLRRIEL